MEKMMCGFDAECVAIVANVRFFLIVATIVTHLRQNHTPFFTVYIKLCTRTLKCPHSHEWCNVFNLTIFVGNYFSEVHEEVVCYITKYWSEVTNPPGDHLLANGRTNSLPVFTIPIIRIDTEFHLN